MSRFATIFNSCVGMLILAMLAGCSGTSEVQVSGNIPEPLTREIPVTAAIVMDKDFSNLTSQPDKKTSIDLGRAQTDLFHKVFKKLFANAEFLDSKEMQHQADLLIIPSVQEVQIATPWDTKLNIYEVWIKYSLDIYDANDEQLASWFMPSYGKTPSAFMKSKTEALDLATQIALRDAGAKLILDFERIPAINQWLKDASPRGAEQ